MRTTNTEAFVLDRIGDVDLPLATIEGSARQQITEFLARPPVTLTDPAAIDPVLPFPISGVEYIYEKDNTVDQVGRAHVRSLRVLPGVLPPKISDEFGNEYKDFTIKGANFSLPALISSMTAANGYIGYGLQESAPIERIARASHVLRAAGIEKPEFVIGLAEPSNIFFADSKKMTGEGEFMGRLMYKKQLAMKAWRDLPEEERDLGKLEEYHRVLNQTAFYISLRATDGHHRLEEVLEDTKLLAKLAQEQSQSPHEYVSSAVQRIARSLGIMHGRLGLVHGFPNGMNLTSRGGLVDLDSVRGQALDLGDEPITVDDMANDLFAFSDSTLLDLVGKNPMVDRTLFVDTYIETMRREGVPVEQIAEILDAHLDKEAKSGIGNLLLEVKLLREPHEYINTLKKQLLAEAFTEDIARVKDVLQAEASIEPEIESVLFEEPHLLMHALSLELLNTDRFAKTTQEYLELLEGGDLDLGELEDFAVALLSEHILASDFIRGALDTSVQIDSMDMLQLLWLNDGIGEDNAALASLDNSIHKMIQKNWHSLVPLIAEQFALASTSNAVLYEGSQAMHVDAYNKFIYEADATSPDLLREMLDDPSIAVATAEDFLDVSPLSGIRYRYRNGRRLHEVVMFGRDIDSGIAGCSGIVDPEDYLVNLHIGNGDVLAIIESTEAGELQTTLVVNTEAEVLQLQSNPRYPDHVMNRSRQRYVSKRLFEQLVGQSAE